MRANLAVTLVETGDAPAARALLPDQVEGVIALLHIALSSSSRQARAICREAAHSVASILFLDGLRADGEARDPGAFEVLETRRHAATFEPSASSRDVPGAAEAYSHAAVIVFSDACHYHAERLATRPEGFGADVHARLTTGLNYTAVDYAGAVRARELFRRNLTGALDAPVLRSLAQGALRILGASPARVFGWAPKVYGQLFRDAGEMRFERDAPGSARLELERLEEELGLEIPDGDYETLAGFLLERAKAIPRAGTMIRHGDVTFTVEQGTLQALQEIRIRW